MVETFSVLDALCALAVFSRKEGKTGPLLKPQPKFNYLSHINQAFCLKRETLPFFSQLKTANFSGDTNQLSLALLPLGNSPFSLRH